MLNRNRILSVALLSAALVAVAALLLSGQPTSAEGTITVYKTPT